MASITLPVAAVDVGYFSTKYTSGRAEHKQASLEELGQLHEPPLTKDAVAGRIRRLLATADKRALDEGIPGTEASLTPDMLEDD